MHNHLSDITLVLIKYLKNWIIHNELHMGPGDYNVFCYLTYLNNWSIYGIYIWFLKIIYVFIFKLLG